MHIFFEGYFDKHLLFIVLGDKSVMSMKLLLGISALWLIAVTCSCNKIDGTPLSSAHSFKWEAIEGNAIEGIDHFGLEGTTNNSNIELRKSSASKMVELNLSDWNSIHSLESLRACIEEKEDLEKLEKISARQIDAEYDLVFGIKKGSSYYILRITNSSVSAITKNEVKVTINGKFRK